MLSIEKVEGQKWDEVYEANNVDDGFSHFDIILL
jgi:hypothetical protein